MQLVELMGHRMLIGVLRALFVGAPGARWALAEACWCLAGIANASNTYASTLEDAGVLGVLVGTLKSAIKVWERH